MTETPVYVGTSHRIDLTGLKLRAVDNTYSYENALDSCTYSLKELSGTEVDSGDLSYVAASNGRYVGALPATVTAALVLLRRYDLFVTSVKGTTKLVSHLRLVASRRD